jgi:hypothetical protein
VGTAATTEATRGASEVNGFHIITVGVAACARCENADMEIMKFFILKSCLEDMISTNATTEELNKVAVLRERERRGGEEK